MPWLPLTARVLGRPQDLALWHHLRGQELSLGRWKWSRHWFSVLELLWWDGSPPEKPLQALDLPTAHIGRGKAVAVLRESGDKDATCVTLLGQGRSHNVPDHTHADAGHFSVFTHGELLAIDTAYFNFDEDVHSVILIDDTPHYPTTRGNLCSGRFMAVAREPWLDYVAVDAAAAKGCLWAERHFLFIRGGGARGYLVILDNINRDNGVHRFAWQLQARAGAEIRVDDDRRATVFGSSARLDCHFFNPLPEDFPTCPHRLRIFADAHQRRSIVTGDPEPGCRLVAEQTGCNATLMSIVLPRGREEPPLAVRDATAPRTFSAFVEHGDVVDQVIYACDHIFVRLPGVQASSSIAVIRRDRGGRVLHTWTDNRVPLKAV